MTLSVHRKATKEDFLRVRKAAERFCRRHGISFDGPFENEAELAIEYTILENKDVRLRNSWRRVYSRALGYDHTDSRHAIAYGHVGIIID